MYVIYEFKEWVGVDPETYYTSDNVNDAVLKVLRNTLESTGSQELGIIIAVLDAEVLGEGVSVHGDPDIYLPTRYRVLAFRPELHEVVRGKVVEVREHGIYVTLGPLDGFVHKNQIMDERRVEMLPDRQGFRGTETGRIVALDDVVRARVTQIGKERRGTRIYKIGLTMRQPYLGREDWIREQVKRELEAGE